ncbi:MAG: hypothetical protein U9R56_02300 [candidate division Zixibacteria bacterium]|nr:hypothetical protein [candidate division Zixibacteria bacterium]
MRLLSGKMKLVLVAVTVIGAGLITMVNFTDACRLEKVTFNERQVDNWPDRFRLLTTSSVFHQPLDSLARHFLSQSDIYKVDISYSMPHTLEIHTNRFTPVCFALDESSGRLKGLDNKGRLVPMPSTVEDWEHPVLTGVGTRKMFKHCNDIRAEMIIRKLVELRERHRDLYRLIDEIDFADSAFLQVLVAGLPCRLKIRAECFLSNMDRFVEFLDGFGPDLEGVTVVDLRFDNMIICAKGKL